MGACSMLKRLPENRVLDCAGLSFSCKEPRQEHGSRAHNLLATPVARLLGNHLEGSACRVYYAGNNIANSRLKWGLRIARACLRGGGAGRAPASIALIIDVALGVDGEFR
jgi:hypothetical protein